MIKTPWMIVLLPVLVIACASAQVKVNSYEVTLDFANPQNVIEGMQSQGWKVVGNIPKPIVAQLFIFCISNYETTPPIALMRHPQVNNALVLCKYKLTITPKDAKDFCRTLFRSESVQVIRIEGLKITCGKGEVI